MDKWGALVVLGNKTRRDAHLALDPTESEIFWKLGMEGCPGRTGIVEMVSEAEGGDKVAVVRRATWEEKRMKRLGSE